MYLVWIVTQLDKMRDGSMVIVDCGLNIEVSQELSKVLDSLGRLVLVQTRQMSGRGREDGIEKWWATTCPLWYDKGEMAFRITKIELDRVSEWTS